MNNYGFRYTREMTPAERSARNLADAGHNVGRTVANAVVMAPRNLVIQTFNLDHPIKWIKSRHQQRQDWRSQPDNELGVTYGQELSRRRTVVEAFELPLSTIEESTSAGHELHISMPEAPVAQGDIQFDTIVNMFRDPIAFLVMAGQGVEQALAFEQMRADDRDQYLMKVFAKVIVPALPDQVMSNNSILFHGEIYMRGKFLGHGGYGSVVEYSTGDGKSIAIKSIREFRLEFRFRRTIEELRTHFIGQGSTLTPDTRGIVNLLGVIWTECAEMLIVLESMPDGNYYELDEKIKLANRMELISDAGLIEVIHRTVVRDATKALTEVNDNKVRHNDMQEENLLFAGGKAKVCDFGLSRTDIKEFFLDSARLGLMANEHLGSHEKPVADFVRGDISRKWPKQILTDARRLLKEDGVGGPHVRAVIEALTKLNMKNDDSVRQLIAASDAYLEAADKVKTGEASWKDLKSGL